jgi:hypothetical protein
MQSDYDDRFRHRQVNLSGCMALMLPAKWLSAGS